MPRRHERKPPGTPSPQRTDRNDAAAQGQPAQAARGQTYGEAKRQRDAQKAVPLPNDSARFARALQAAERADTGDPIDLLGDGPPETSQPITAGLPSGPGPGPEAIPGVTGQAPTREQTLAILQWLPALEARASDPDRPSSATFRQFVRHLRAQLPPDAEMQAGDLFDRG